MPDDRADVVVVHLFAAARAAAGQDVVIVAPGALQAVLDGVERACPGFAAVRACCSFLVDGIAVHDDAVAVPGGSRVDALPPFAGG